jgi:N-dimethylarginine dimethylaminohydrolase
MVTAESGYTAPFIRSDIRKLVGVLMVAPAASVDRLTPIYGESSPIAERAIEQYNVFRNRLAGHGVKTHVIEPEIDLPSASLVSDCAVVVGSGAIMMRPSSVEQRRYVPMVERALTALGIPIVGRVEAPGLLDGNDVVLGPHVAYVGIPHNPSLAQQRSNHLGRRQFEALVQGHGFRAVELSLSADVHRLRNVLAFADADCALAAPDKVDLVAVKDTRIVEVPRGEEYACGVLTLGPRSVVANLRFRYALIEMKKAKISIEAIDLWEYGKTGVGPFALAIPLKRV